MGFFDEPDKLRTLVTYQHFSIGQKYCWFDTGEDKVVPPTKVIISVF